MNTPTKPWPIDFGATLEQIEAQIDAMPPRRYLEMHRVTVACTANACDSGRKACPSPDACVLADNDEAGRIERMPEGALIALMLAVSLTLAAAIIVILGAR